MKSNILLLLCLFPCILPAQDVADQNPWEPVKPELPKAIKDAAVLSRWVLRPATMTEGRVVIEEIAPPQFPRPVDKPLATAVPLSADSWTFRKAAAFSELRLFSPTVILTDSSYSLVRWWSADPFTGYQEFAAWVDCDLSSINACGDLTVGSRRYCLMASARHAKDRFTGLVDVPSSAAFQEKGGIILIKGNSANLEAMEPLSALLAKYEKEGPAILAADAAIKADNAARAAWEKAHPRKPREKVIKHWVVRSNLPPKTAAPSARVLPLSDPSRR